MKQTNLYIGKCVGGLLDEKIICLPPVQRHDFIQGDVFIKKTRVTALEKEYSKIQIMQMAYEGSDSSIEIPEYFNYSSQTALPSNIKCIDSDIRVYRIEDLGNRNYVVGKPISVKINYDEDNDLIADIPEIEVYSIGCDSITDALSDLKVQIIDLFNDIIDLPDERLGHFPLKWKKFLLEHITRKLIDGD